MQHELSNNAAYCVEPQVLCAACNEYTRKSICIEIKCSGKSIFVGTGHITNNGNFEAIIISGKAGESDLKGKIVWIAVNKDNKMDK